MSEHTIRYRTESFSGGNYRDAAEVMAFETLELGNADILDYLLSTCLKDRPIAHELKALSDELGGEEGEEFIDDMSFEDMRNFYRRVLDDIRLVTGISVNYVLWLTDKESVQSVYGQYMADANDYDSYLIGPVILSDLGSEGALYGYTELPQPVHEQELFQRLFSCGDIVNVLISDCCDGLAKVLSITDKEISLEMVDGHYSMIYPSSSLTDTVLSVPFTDILQIDHVREDSCKGVCSLSQPLSAKASLDEQITNASFCASQKVKDASSKQTAKEQKREFLNI